MSRTKKAKHGRKALYQKSQNPKAQEENAAVEADRANYVFFYKTKELKAGWASQWWAERSFTSADGSVEYKTAEHWMMTEKARLFGDEDIRAQILAVSDPNKVKALGRKIANFDEKVWEENRLRIVEEGNELKFRQDDNLREKLLATGDKILVEASPQDRIWGIGYPQKTALLHKDEWGLNLLGQALMNVRAKLRAEQPQAEAQTSASAPAPATVPGDPVSTTAPDDA
ncbi:DUF1768-domain-containing protein [Exidia glandulosa HHB12029]|uniref:DUF1768-domain-containing protein n=1 Tax=Exidia glandulosa HHB12029 TaxID=1314781 RepID=A0A165F2I9_EXIGL|nr:DUF1768-domain-containing protein [Exidia glandulosa HHB12029]